MPLENQTVRFIDNFSNGNRGAASAEYFLKAGYAVVFMHRQFSLEPFHRHYTHNPHKGFLDYLVPQQDGSVKGKSRYIIAMGSSESNDCYHPVDPQYAAEMHEILVSYRKAIEANRILLLDFVTLSDYLFKLKSSTRILARLREKAMYYLAAAVSDFFIPSEKMAEHKIQSREGALTLTLDQVPKFLKPLVSAWATQGFIVSFKVTTNNTNLYAKMNSMLLLCSWKQMRNYWCPRPGKH